MGLPHVEWRSSLLLSVVISFSMVLFPQHLLAVNVAFTYDAAGRVLTAQYEDGQRVGYVYDSVGNMTQQVENGWGSGGSIGPVIQLLLVY